MRSGDDIKSLPSDTDLTAKSTRISVDHCAAWFPGLFDLGSSCIPPMCALSLVAKWGLPKPSSRVRLVDCPATRPCMLLLRCECLLWYLHRLVVSTIYSIPTYLPIYAACLYVRPYSEFPGGRNFFLFFSDDKSLPSATDQI